MLAAHKQTDKLPFHTQLSSWQVGGHAGVGDVYVTRRCFCLYDKRQRY